jgi:hypothetical protein
MEVLLDDCAESCMGVGGMEIVRVMLNYDIWLCLACGSTT